MRAAFQTLGALALYPVLALVALGQERPRRPVDGIMDNSFLIEEAYNQEAGVVQHIFNAVYGRDRISSPHAHLLDLSFTQEWPVFGQTHQFSYTVPYSATWESEQPTHGLRDVLLNYRYQVYLDEMTLTGFAPRFSLILPTGDDEKGLGSGDVGYQWNLPLSTTLSDRWFVHANAGLTFLPGRGLAAPRDSLNYNLGTSGIYCVSETFNLMLEWVGYWTETYARDGANERQFSSVISPGMRYAFNFRSGSQMVVGLGVPLGLTKAPEVGVFVYFSFEHKLFGHRQQPTAD